MKSLLTFQRSRLRLFPSGHSSVLPLAEPQSQNQQGMIIQSHFALHRHLTRPAHWETRSKTNVNETRSANFENRQRVSWSRRRQTSRRSERGSNCLWLCARYSRDDEEEHLFAPRIHREEKSGCTAYETKHDATRNAASRIENKTGRKIDGGLENRGQFPWRCNSDSGNHVVPIREWARIHRGENKEHTRSKDARRMTGWYRDWRREPLGRTQRMRRSCW